MATVFERSMPALDDAQTTQILHRRRRRDSVEVIDVDELDDDIYQTHRAPEPGLSRPAQRRRLSAPSEIISLVESDDDDIVVSESHVRPASRTRLQSPPPRSQPWNFVPPVPPVPHRYAGQTSLPMRRHAPTSSSPPVRPSDQPFPFEANMHQQHPHQHRRLPPIPGAGPSSRPQPHIPRVDDVLPPRPLQAAPPMGLGGALIAQNRSRQHNYQHHAHLAPYEAAGNSFLGRVGSGVRRIFGGPALAPPDENPRNGINFLALGNNFGFLDDPVDDDEDPDRMLAFQLLAEDVADGPPGFRFHNPAGAFIRSEVLRRRNNNTREESPYQKEYTHPRPPENGFTFDFTPKSPVEVIDVTSPTIPIKHIPSGPIVIEDDDDDNSLPLASTSQSNAQSTSQSSSSFKPLPQSPTKSTTTLACARCLDHFVLGSNLTSEDQKNRRVWGLRCGHLIDGKCLKEIGQPHYTDQATDLDGNGDDVVDRKGKGKAKAADVEGDDVEFHDVGPIPGSYNHNHEHKQDPESNSIRSRLRPRNNGSSTSASTSHSTASSSSSAQTTIKRTSKSKVAANAAPALPPPEYIWHCPVTGCGRIHVSIKINGEWIPERDDSIYASSDSASSVGGFSAISIGGGSARIGTGGGVGARIGTGGWRARGGRGRGRNTQALFGLGVLGAGPSGVEREGGARGAIPLFL